MILRVAIALDLLVSAAFLIAWDIGWIPQDPVKPELPFLQFVNANMMVCVVAAGISAAVGLARRRAPPRRAVPAAILLVTVAVAAAAELLCAAGEFVHPPPGWLPTVGVWAMSAARVLGAAWLVAVVLTRGDGAGLGALDPRRRPAIAWPAAGCVAYALTDLVRYRMEISGDPGFSLGEVGFFAGYLAIALGAHRRPAGDRP